MIQGKFNVEDKQKMIQYLNFIARKSQFNMNTQEIIEYFGLLNYIQKTILPKIDSNILEIVSVTEEEDT